MEKGYNGQYDALTERQRQIALARLDLLKAWKRYRESHEGSVTKLNKEFVTAYNAGPLCQHLYSILGKTSVNTLYRWEQELEGTEDWRRLVPRYNYGRKEPRITDEEKKWLLGFLLKGTEISIGSAIRYMKFRMAELGIPSPSSPMTLRRWAEHFRKTHYHMWVAYREGRKAVLDKVAVYIKRDVSKLKVGQVLVADGHRLNFQVINPFTGKPCRAVLVGFLDWKSWDLMGYEIMLEENTQCIASALRNALIYLGAYPEYVYQDNGKAFRARFFHGTVSFDEAGFYGLYGRLGITAIFSLPYNAKAKAIERYFREFAEFSRLVPSYVGPHAMAKPAYLKPNEKEHRAMHNDFVPTLEEAVQIVERFRQFMREQPCPHVPGKTIGEVSEEGRQRWRQKKGTLNIDELDDLMMVSETRTIRQNGIRFLGAEYYNDNLFGLRDRVIVRYSLFDLSKVKIYTTDGRFLGIAERVMPVNPLANYIGDVKDMEELKQRQRLQRRQIREAFNIQGLRFKVQKAEIIEIPEHRAQISFKAEPGDERRIPNEAVMEDETWNLEHGRWKTEDRQAHFEEAWQRYEYLIRQKELTEEDRQWLREYMKSEEYRMLYGAQEAI